VSPSSSGARGSSEPRSGRDPVAAVLVVSRLRLGDGVLLVVDPAAGPPTSLALVVRAVLPDPSALPSEPATLDRAPGTAPEVVLTVTGDALGIHPDDLQPFLIRPAADDVIAATIREVALDLVRRTAGEIDEPERARLGAMLVRLVAALLAGRPVDEWPDSDPRRLLRLRVAFDVRAHLGDPGLGAGVVARRLGVSERSVHLAFADGGETVGRLVRRLRAERARIDLTAAPPGAVARPAVARRWAIRDLE